MQVVSQLSLVDLAGSERTVSTVASTSGKSSTRFQEAVNVNQSLFVLRRVITALSKKDSKGNDASGHVPYRESKLTSLLQNSLGGSSYLIMFACLAATDRHDDENLSTLQYASQAASIKNQPQVNIDPKDRAIQQLQAKLGAAHRYLLRAMGLQELPEDLLQEELAAATAASGAKAKAVKPRPAKTPRRPTSLGPNPPKEVPKRMDSKTDRVERVEKTTSTTTTSTSWSVGDAEPCREADATSGTSSFQAAPPAAPVPSHRRLADRYGPAKTLNRFVQGRWDAMPRSPKFFVFAFSETACKLAGAVQKSPRSSDWPFFARRPVFVMHVGMPAASSNSHSELRCARSPEDRGWGALRGS